MSSLISELMFCKMSQVLCYVLTGCIILVPFTSKSSLFCYSVLVKSTRVTGYGY